MTAAIMWGVQTTQTTPFSHTHSFSLPPTSRRGPEKGEVGNTLINTNGKTVLPLFSVCNKHTGVT